MSRSVNVSEQIRRPLLVMLTALIMGGTGVVAAESLGLRDELSLTAANEDEELIAELKARQLELGQKIEALKVEESSKRPTPVSGAPVASSEGRSSEAGLVVHLNSADQATLETLPNIGASKAQAIIEYRNTHGRFSSIEELDNVKGIGESTVAKLRPYLILD